MIITKTIFCDLDGTLIVHHGNFLDTINREPTWLPGAKEQIFEWNRLGYRIFITTGRPSSYREETEAALKKLGIPYEQLIMDCGNGERIIVNDRKSDGTITASSINLNRNEGFIDG